jgi:hypothetical protein
MSNQNSKPRPDVTLLTPNDMRRVRVKLNGQDPQELLNSDSVEDIFQLLILAYRLREDPSFTWDQAGDTAPGDVLDMDGQSPPDLPAATPTENGSSPAKSAGSSSKRKRAGSAAARSSASTTA